MHFVHQRIRKVMPAGGGLPHATQIECLPKDPWYALVLGMSHCLSERAAGAMPRRQRSRWEHATFRGGSRIGCMERCKPVPTCQIISSPGRKSKAKAEWRCAHFVRPDSMLLDTEQPKTRGAPSRSKDAINASRRNMGAKVVARHHKGVVCPMSPEFPNGWDLGRNTRFNPQKQRETPHFSR